MHESIFLNNLINSTWQEYYEKLLFDINWLRYQENTNMQTINKIVPMVIKHCLQHLPTHLDERCKIFENMISLSGSKYKLNQFIENLENQEFYTYLVSKIQLLIDVYSKRMKS